MEKDKATLIWKYLDEECTPTEKEELTRLLGEDAAFAEEFALARQLHQSLQGIEQEEPSMRFSTNLQEKLPALYRPVQVSADLLPKTLVRLFGTIVGAVALMSLGLFFGAQHNAAAKLNLLDRYTLNLGIFSNPMVFGVFLFSLGVLSYFLMDFAFKKWILKK